ncbi:MAG TPA: DUF3850 domain-containing protein [Gemmatimonadaceae bacterium]|nr:DUF3850 domain-containing protein [Gemmatimonadaceae bacterium]
MSVASKLAALQDLGDRLQHHIAARGIDPDQVARIVGVAVDDFALALTGHYDLSVSTVYAVLTYLDLEWWHLFGTDLCYPPRTHEVTLESDAWHAVDGGLQPFDIRRDTERYRAGDYLHLYEKLGNQHTGKILIKRVNYILYSVSVSGPPGYVIMALQDPDTPLHMGSLAPLSDVQRLELQTRMEACKLNPNERRSWEDLEATIRSRSRTTSRKED